MLHHDMHLEAYVKVHCPECGSANMRSVAGCLAECGKCGVGYLTKEYDQWKSKKDYEVKVKRIPIGEV